MVSGGVARTVAVSDGGTTANRKYGGGGRTPVVATRDGATTVNGRRDGRVGGTPIHCGRDGDVLSCGWHRCVRGGPKLHIPPHTRT